MKPITVAQIAKAVGGTLIFGTEEAQVSDVIIDSRQAHEGALFVPIIGERVDAHRFIPDVMAAGASCTFTSKKDVTCEKGAGIYVEDTLDALQKLAAWYRRMFEIPVVGITGSVGKTTTKEMISAVLEKKFSTVKTIGNLNSQIGVSLMMFHLEESTQMAVIEMGISMPGEMDRLVEIARPTTAVLTNVGVSHIGNLGSRENICREKTKIIKNIPDQGTLYVCGNGDLEEMSKNCIPYEINPHDIATRYYGMNPSFAYYASDLTVSDGKQNFVFHCPEGEWPVELRVMGEHNVNNAVIAMAIGLQYGVDPEQAAEALREYEPIAMRGVIKKAHGVSVIDDTYNASPDSINSNIHAMFSYGEGRKIAVLADVLELGERSEKLHEGIGRYIAEEASKGNTLSVVVSVGDESRFITDYVSEHTPIEAHHFEEKTSAIAFLKDILKPGDWVLVKGSRGMHMDEVVEQLTKE